MYTYINIFPKLVISAIERRAEKQITLPQRRKSYAVFTSNTIIITRARARSEKPPAARNMLEKHQQLT